ncbi:DUF4882 domain-containing protein [Acinetobacter sp. Ac_3412]|uniref:DUF4882 family protein n=1 Tax=Acinetobacter sp. Ac_3412 TaxID=1848935 RepID=UPI0014902D83|nr:DUF4882 domain-containing protein [Acinetobacter sp. Ac_3412]
MKKIILGTLISAVSISSTFAACTYNFDATQAQITTAFAGFQKFPAISGQKTSFTVAATAENSQQMFIAANGNAISGQNNGSNVPQSGIFAYEYKVKVPTILLTNNEQIFMYPNYADAYYSNGKGQIVALYANHLQGSTTPNKVMFAVGSTVDGATGMIELPVTSTSDGYQNIGIYVNQDTKQVGVIFNGVNKGYVSTNPNKIISLAFTNGMAYYGIDSTSPNIGNVYSIELITDSTKLTQTYPTGTKDICGNTI